MKQPVGLETIARLGLRTGSVLSKLVCVHQRISNPMRAQTTRRETESDLPLATRSSSKMSHEPTIDDEDYASSEDSDFAPDEAPEQGDASSDVEDETAGDTAEPAPVKRKRQTQAGGGDDAEDAGFENSGDEAIIGKGKKKQKKGRQAQRDEDEGGEGGLIKTRSMRAVE